MIKIKINDVEFLVKPNISIIEACKYIGVIIPRFCYHEMLTVAGNCRMCLIELENIEKPIAACVTTVENGMSVWVNTPFVKKARQNVVETLLLNHPLDCPVCDQAGECDLQDQSKLFGNNYSRFFFSKRGVDDKNCGPLIKTIMTRCIHCTRCVRFGSEIAGIDFLITLNRGTSTEIGGYVSQMFSSEISGNVIDLCPVGALTSKPYAFKGRPWELRLNETIDVTDSLGSNLYVNFKESEISRILPKNNDLINGNLISDKARFSYDATKNNRVQNIFENEYSHSFTLKKWKDVFNELDYLFEQRNYSFINIFFNEELDFQSMDLLRKIENKYGKKVKLHLLNSTYESSNFYTDAFTNNITAVEKSENLCVLLSINSRLESSIINARLRFKQKNTPFYSVTSFGQSFSNNFPINFIGLNTSEIVKLLEGKNFIGNLISKSNSPLFILGESLTTRFTTLNSISTTLKSFFNNCKIIQVNSVSNGESCRLLNLKRNHGLKTSFNLLNSVNEKTYKSLQNFCKPELSANLFLNLDDNLRIRKFVNSSFSLNLFVWLNTHGSKIASQNDFILPTLTPFEDNQVFINLEKRAQRTNKTFDHFFNGRSCLQILRSSFNFVKQDFVLTSSFTDCIYEAINLPEIFESLNKEFSLNNLLISKTFIISDYVSTYPVKTFVEDFYCSNTFSKNSLTMIQCSQAKRTQDTNFPNNFS